MQKSFREKKQQSPNIGENKSVGQNMLRKKSGKRKGEAMVSCIIQKSRQIMKLHDHGLESSHARGRDSGKKCAVSY